MPYLPPIAKRQYIKPVFKESPKRPIVAHTCSLCNTERPIHTKGIWFERMGTGKWNWVCRACCKLKGWMT